MTAASGRGPSSSARRSSPTSVASPAHAVNSRSEGNGRAPLETGNRCLADSRAASATWRPDSPASIRTRRSSAPRRASCGLGSWGCQVVHSRYARSTLVVCPPVDEPFEGVEIATIPDPEISGNLGKAWGVVQLLRRRGVDLAIVENHLPAAAFIAVTSGARVILHTHAYVTPPRKHARRGLPGPGDARAFRLRVCQRIRPGPVPRRFPWAACRFSAPCPTGSTCKLGRRQSPRSGEYFAWAGR